MATAEQLADPSFQRLMLEMDTPDGIHKQNQELFQRLDNFLTDALQQAQEQIPPEQGSSLFDDLQSIVHEHAEQMLYTLQCLIDGLRPRPDWPIYRAEAHDNIRKEFEQKITDWIRPFLEARLPEPADEPEPEDQAPTHVLAPRRYDN